MNQGNRCNRRPAILPQGVQAQQKSSGSFLLSKNDLDGHFALKDLLCFEKHS